MAYHIPIYNETIFTNIRAKQIKCVHNLRGKGVWWIPVSISNGWPLVYLTVWQNLFYLLASYFTSKIYETKIGHPSVQYSNKKYGIHLAILFTQTFVHWQPGLYVYKYLNSIEYFQGILQIAFLLLAAKATTCVNCNNLTLNKSMQQVCNRNDIFSQR